MSNCSNPQLAVRLEAHAHGATLYFRESLSARSVAHAIVLCEGLGLQTRSLRVDLRSVRLFDPDAFARLAAALDAWRSSRRGTVLMKFADRRLRPDRRSPVSADRHRAVEVCP